MADKGDVNLGGAQFASHKWAEPVFVVSVMIGSLIINRRKNFSILRGDTSRSGTLSPTSEGRPMLSDDEHATVRFQKRSCFGKEFTIPDTSAFGNNLHSRVLQKFPFLIEMFYWALNYAAYSFTKAIAASLYATKDGVTELAQEHGISILNFEHDSMFSIFFPIKEVDFQTFFTTGHPLALTFFNRIYSLVHIPGTVTFLSWYYYAAPDHAAFAVARRTMTLGNFAAFFVFCFYPCMPPRLLPESFGFHDTVRQENAESVWVGGKNVNQLAAMPSLHFTYAFVIGCTFIYHSGIHWRSENKALQQSTFGRCLWLLAGLCYPLLVLSVIVATANHYYLDAVVALFTTSLAFFINRIWMLLLPAEGMLLWVLRLKKPVPTTGQRVQGAKKVKEDESDYRYEVV
ncbi:hypothetical protein D6D25_07547 [Aureobasidium pullulans]|nr:hypothetical protein D6D25_07547 [Aureobasidium pullulans]